MSDTNQTRTAAASAFGRPGRAAGLVFESGARIWRRSAELSKANALVTACIAAAGFSLALAGMWSAWDALSEARALAAWGRAPAVILAASIERGCGGDPGAYEARVRYRYEVAGTFHIGERASLDGLECGSERAARDQTARHPVDSKATVRYDPVRVSQSVLSLGESPSAAWLGILAMAALATVSAVCVGRGLRGYLLNSEAP